MLVGGRGFVKTNLNVETMMFLANSKNEDDLEEILYKISYDLELYGGFALNLIWSKDRTRISEINYIDPATIRIQPDDPQKGYPQIENYWVSDGWEKPQDPANTPILYPGFSTVDRKKASQILYVKAHRAGVQYYAQPDYLPAIYWMELEYQISQFHLANVVNGFTPGFYINWPIGDNTSDEEKQSLVNRLKAEFAGSINAGQVVISLQDDINKPTITTIQSNASDKKFIQLDSLVERGILQGHRVNNPALFGVATPGKLGDGGEGDRVQSSMEFEIDYVNPQQRIIEKVLNKIARINGITDRLMINKYSDSFKKVGSDSATEVLDIISNTNVTPKQKYSLLIALNYTHQVASDLSTYTEGNEVHPTIQKPNTEDVVKSETTTTTTTIKTK